MKTVEINLIHPPTLRKITKSLFMSWLHTQASKNLGHHKCLKHQQLQIELILWSIKTCNDAVWSKLLLHLKISSTYCQDHETQMWLIQCKQNCHGGYFFHGRDNYASSSSCISL